MEVRSASIDQSVASRGQPDFRPEKVADGELETGATDKKKDAAATLGTDQDGKDDSAFPRGIKLALILGSSYLSMFLVALDRLIVTTAIPKITDEFHTVTNVGWYGSAYLLTNCAFQLFFGKLYVVYSIKLVFLTSILIFEIGSAVCGSAPTSNAFIVGRAIAGVGSAGIFSGAITILVYCLPLHRRPFYQGLFGAVFGVANVISPLLGGAFTDSTATWRWCFYINLPVGAFSIICIACLFRIPDQKITHLRTRQKLAQLDGPGLLTLLSGVTCLLLALEWGGTTYSWNNGRIIALLAIAVVLLICFIGIQIACPKTATIPPSIFVQRSIMTGSLAMFTSGATMMITFYYLPIWFQAIEETSAVESGLRILPLVIAQVTGSLAGGIGIQKMGYYTPFMMAGIIMMAVGAGLLTVLQVDTSEGEWIGYQIPYGIGLGITLQAPLLASQTVLAVQDVSIGTSLMFFSQLLGGSIFVSVGQNLFDNYFIEGLNGVPGVDVATILEEGATAITNISEPAKSVVVAAYNNALKKVFIAGLAMACFTLLGASGMEWKSVKKTVSEEDSER
ncbi:MFS general substrate transporter [Cryphonectria parasitica EP155]|uniref:MFS general substrate transporter n=1 Tax=Cryphonectria parasitica (strain ATCC 38755 / EP155) TaxID=660469 RepID=A0A9P4Y662_CRYP1|nr:MFS general substrate transporter [Cryphonectria parasitica EP155]KAF3767097.1 MFS general substrate transporter [Cryphonectria parasitica EP155]